MTLTAALRDGNKWLKDVEQPYADDSILFGTSTINNTLRTVQLSTTSSIVSSSKSFMNFTQHYATFIPTKKLLYTASHLLLKKLHQEFLMLLVSKFSADFRPVAEGTPV